MSDLLYGLMKFRTNFKPQKKKIHTVYIIIKPIHYSVRWHEIVFRMIQCDINIKFTVILILSILTLTNI